MKAEEDRNRSGTRTSDPWLIVIKGPLEALMRITKKRVDAVDWKNYEMIKLCT